MRGYTAKVGLRKPAWDEPSWTQTFLPEPTFKVRAGSLCAAAGLVDTIRQAMQAIDARQPDGPVYAETIHDRPDMSCPHCPCTYSTECCYCDGTRTPLEDA